MKETTKNFFKLYLTVEQYCKSQKSVSYTGVLVENDYGEVFVRFNGDATLNEMKSVFNEIYNLIRILNFKVDSYNNDLGQIVLTVNGIDEADYFEEAWELELEFSH